MFRDNRRRYSGGVKFLLVASVLLAGTPERVIDADTLQVGGVRVRLWGIQAPERREYCIRKGQAGFRCDDVGRERLRALVASGVECEAKGGGDPYGRTIALCRTADGRDVGREMVASGYAMAYRRFSRDYVADEAAARSAGQGWWSCSITAPERWERAKRCGIRGSR